MAEPAGLELLVKAGGVGGTGVVLLVATRDTTSLEASAEFSLNF
jgi:hypothetical protein